ncbi:MAPEG family protein [Altererythrobacter lauratis]|uniref:MAPEG family protein n=1 Tax=Alteraurantiacibacter lauratis TaxID=2054627 RepID=A0ABV7EF64_9SPHN
MIAQSTEITVLGLGCLLLLAHILLGARDESLPPLDPVAGRLERAKTNFLETFPIAIVALMGVAVTGKGSDTTALAAWARLGARTVYLPLYWAGVPKLRTPVWAVSLGALLVLLGVLIRG